jgi:hypothetical protein
LCLCERRSSACVSGICSRWLTLETIGSYITLSGSTQLSTANANSTGDRRMR